MPGRLDPPSLGQTHALEQRVAVDGLADLEPQHTEFVVSDAPAFGGELRGRAVSCGDEFTLPVRLGRLDRVGQPFEDGDEVAVAEAAVHVLRGVRDLAVRHRPVLLFVMLLLVRWRPMPRRYPPPHEHAAPPWAADQHGGARRA
jgi:hypothetical protein